MKRGENTLAVTSNLPGAATLVRPSVARQGISLFRRLSESYFSRSPLRLVSQRSGGVALEPPLASDTPKDAA